MNFDLAEFHPPACSEWLMSQYNKPFGGFIVVAAWISAMLERDCASTVDMLCMGGEL